MINAEQNPSSTVVRDVLISNVYQSSRDYFSAFSKNVFLLNSILSISFLTYAGNVAGKTGLADELAKTALRAAPFSLTGIVLATLAMFAAYWTQRKHFQKLLLCKDDVDAMKLAGSLLTWRGKMSLTLLGLSIMCFIISISLFLIRA